MEKRRTLWILGIIALIVASVPVLARQHGPHDGFGPFGERMFEHVAQRLDLSVAQQEQIQAVLEEYRPAIEGQRSLMSSARSALRDQVHADTFDESAIRQAAADLASLEEDMAVSRALIARDIRQILTPEQQAEAKQMMQDARAFRKHAGEGGRGRRGGPDFGEED